MRKPLLLIVSALVGALTLSSCGAGGANTTINVTMIDFQFTPNSFTVPAGKEITVNAANNGAVEHEFVVFKLGLDAGEKFGPEDQENVYWKVDVMPGQSTSATFTAPTEPGDYYVTCGIGGHLEAGMAGTLTVVAGE